MYLLYFATLGLFALIRLWILIFNQNSIHFDTKNQPKSNKETFQNSIEFLIEFWTDFLKILAPCWHLSGSHIGSKIDQKGGALKSTRALWQQLRARPAQGYPRTLKIAAQGSPRLEKYLPMAPLRPRKASTWI